MKGKLLLSIGLAGLLLALVLGLFALAGPPTARAAGGEVFIVNNPGDNEDSNPGDCSCNIGLPGVCTLRAAIQEANTCSGPQTIKFSPPTADRLMYITPTTALPIITDTETVIDASDCWLDTPSYHGPGIVLEGNSAFSGLVITASHCAIYGLWIRNFGGHGVHLYGGAFKNAIGGAGAHQGNVITDNGQNGVRIEGATTTDNVVESNYIGTILAGISGHGNGQHGISVWEAGNTVITGNRIAGNGWSGVAMDYVSSGKIRNNQIGFRGFFSPLGNGFYGIHLAHGSHPVVISNTIAYNKRGIYMDNHSSPRIYHNTIYGHNASASSLNYAGYGGGIFCYDSAPVISENVITNNVAYTGTDRTGYGGGIALLDCDEALIGSNTVVSNTANTTGYGNGGGIYLISSNDVLVSGNTIMSNTAGANPDSRGGGLHLDHSNTGPHYHIVGNTIRGNSAAADGRGYGGGVYLLYSDATLDSNLILGNRATYGGGVETENGAFFTMMNNILAQNSFNGVRTWAIPGPSRGLLVNNTIVQNGSSGVLLYQNSALTLTNNIIVSHTNGIHAIPGNTNTVVADYTLFYGNSRDTYGSDITSTHAITGRDPLFLDPAGGNYHLRAGSPAVDAGIAVPWLTWDIDSDPRPIGAGYDIGADEARFVYLPLVLRNF